MIVSIFVILFLLIALGAFVRGAFVYGTLASRRSLAYKRPEARPVTEADNP